MLAGQFRMHRIRNPLKVEILALWVLDFVSVWPDDVAGSAEISALPIRVIGMIRGSIILRLGRAV